MVLLKSVEVRVRTFEEWRPKMRRRKIRQVLNITRNKYKKRYTENLVKVKI